MKLSPIVLVGSLVASLLACKHESGPQRPVEPPSIPPSNPLNWERVATGLNSFATCVSAEPCAFAAEGLTFARSPGTALTFAAANDICTKLSILNQSDWRLPTLEEMLKAADGDIASILDADRLNVSQTWVWTSTPGPEDADTALVVHLKARAYYAPKKSELFGVLCIR